MIDNRASPRRKVGKLALLDDEGHTVPVQCRLHDLSEGGALVDLMAGPALQGCLNLYFDMIDEGALVALNRKCCVVRRSGVFVGVRFLGTAR